MKIKTSAVLFYSSTILLFTHLTLPLGTDAFPQTLSEIARSRPKRESFFGQIKDFGKSLVKEGRKVIDDAKDEYNDMKSGATDYLNAENLCRNLGLVEPKYYLSCIQDTLNHLVFGTAMKIYRTVKNKDANSHEYAQQVEDKEITITQSLSQKKEPKQHHKESEEITDASEEDALALQRRLLESISNLIASMQDENLKRSRKKLKKIEEARMDSERKQRKDLEKSQKEKKSD